MATLRLGALASGPPDSAEFEKNPAVHTKYIHYLEAIKPSGDITYTNIIIYQRIKPKIQCPNLEVHLWTYLITKTVVAIKPLIHKINILK